MDDKVLAAIADLRGTAQSLGQDLNHEDVFFEYILLKDIYNLLVALGREELATETERWCGSRTDKEIWGN